MKLYELGRLSSGAAAQLAGARCPVQVDVGFGDAVTPAPEPVEYPTILPELPAPRLRAYPRETVVAEKLEALVTLGIANSRMKDYFDLYFELADALAAADAQLQVIFLCGRNETLARRLQSAHQPFPHLVLGYRDDIHRYLALADLFVGKAGPQSISEALALGLPLLIDEWRVLPQERALTRWVKASGVGATFSRPAQFVREAQALAARPGSGSAPELARRNTASGDILRIVDTLVARKDATDAVWISSPSKWL